MRVPIRALLPLIVLLSLVVAGCGGAPCPEPTSGEKALEHHGGQASPHHGHDGHRFDDPDKWAKQWEGEDRTAWQKPDEVIGLLELEPDSVVADVGAGTGYFAVRLAARLPDGHVWAADIEPAMVRHVGERAREEELDNIFAILARPDDPLLPERVDRALMVNVYHHVANRVRYLRTLGGYLAPGGRVAIVDFQMGDIPVGPPESMRVPPDEARAELEEAGFRVVTDDRDTLPHQYVLVAEPR